MKPAESFSELVEAEAERIRMKYGPEDLAEGSRASRWFVKDRDRHGSDILRPKKGSLRSRFSVRKAPGGWAVDDEKTEDSASFRALDEVAVWIEQVSGESIE